MPNTSALYIIWIFDHVCQNELRFRSKKYNFAQKVQNQIDKTLNI